MARNMATSLTAVALLCCAGVARADGPATSPAAPTAATATVKKTNAHDPNRMICKTEEVTGSRLEGHRTCMTAADWDSKARQGRENLDDAQARAAMGNNSPNLASGH